MTVYLDSSALLAIAIEGSARSVVIEALETDANWYSSEISLVEALGLVARLSEEKIIRDDLEDCFRLMWDRIALIPVDQECLNEASKIIMGQPVRVSSAIHLASLSRLPTPITFLTFDPELIVQALERGIKVQST